MEHGIEPHPCSSSPGGVFFGAQMLRPRNRTSPDKTHGLDDGVPSTAGMRPFPFLLPQNRALGTCLRTELACLSLCPANGHATSGVVVARSMPACS